MKSVDHREIMRPADPGHRTNARVRRLASQIEHFDEGALAFISEVLRERLAGAIEPTDEQYAIARATFLTAIRAQGRSSVAAYDAWKRDQLTELNVFSSRQLRRLFGGPERSWDVVKQTLGVGPIEDITAKRLVRRAKTTLIDAAVEGVRAFHSSGEVPFVEQSFLRWCVKQENSPTPEVVGSLPTTSRQIRRLGTSWPELLDRAGLDLEAQAARERLSAATYTDAEALRLLREFAVGRKASDCGAAALDAWMESELPEWAHGRRLLKSRTIERRFGGLPRAFYRAGVFTIGEFALKLAGQLRLGREVALASLAAAVAEDGADLQFRELEHWRARTVAAAASDGHLLLMPGPDSMARILGGRSWTVARQVAIDFLESGGTPQAGVVRDDLLEAA